MKDIAGWRTFLVQHVLTQVLGEKAMALVLNRFPYDLQHAQHYVLWSRGTQEVPQAVVTAFVRAQLPSRSFVWYKNPHPTLQNELSQHWHVFARKQSVPL